MNDELIKRTEAASKEIEEILQKYHVGLMPIMQFVDQKPKDSGIITPKE